MTLYLDVVLLINFIFNGMILLLTGKLMRRQTSFLRIVVSALFATIIIPIMIYFPHSFFNTFLTKLIFSIIIVYLAFGINSKLSFFKHVCMFYFISFTIGGGLLAIQSMNNTNLLSTNKITLSFLFVAFPVVWFFTKNQMDNHSLEKIKYDYMYDVTITLNEKSITTTGYMDSGNQLVDPITNYPVIICDEAYLTQFFSQQDWSIMKEIVTKQNIADTISKSMMQLYIIPFKAVGTNQDYLFAIRPQNITLSYDDIILETNKVFIGIQLADLSSEADYHCLLHPKIMQHAVHKTA